MEKFTINNKNILLLFENGDYVYNKKHNRVFKLVDNSKIYDIILVDVDGDMRNFISLKAMDSYEISTIDFNYIDYAKEFIS